MPHHGIIIAMECSKIKKNVLVRRGLSVFPTMASSKGINGGWIKRGGLEKVEN